MSKTSLGDLKLSPLKENGKFVFINNEVRVNGKLNKGDYIKIFVDGYEMKDGKYVAGPCASYAFSCIAAISRYGSTSSFILTNCPFLSRSSRQSSRLL